MNKNSKIVGNTQSRCILVDGVVLEAGKSLKFRNHSPDGFSWGYLGSGCSQLSLALLLEATDAKTALKLYQDLKFDLIARLPMDKNFELPAYKIYEWLDTKKDKNEKGNEK